MFLPASNLYCAPMGTDRKTGAWMRLSIYEVTATKERGHRRKRLEKREARTKGTNVAMVYVIVVASNGHHRRRWWLGKIHGAYEG